MPLTASIIGLLVVSSCGGSDGDPDASNTSSAPTGSTLADDVSVISTTVAASTTLTTTTTTTTSTTTTTTLPPEPPAVEEAVAVPSASDTIAELLTPGLLPVRGEAADVLDLHERVGGEGTLCATDQMIGDAFAGGALINGCEFAGPLRAEGYVEWVIADQTAADGARELDRIGPWRLTEQSFDSGRQLNAMRVIGNRAFVVTLPNVSGDAEATAAAQPVLDVVDAHFDELGLTDATPTVGLDGMAQRATLASALPDAAELLSLLDGATYVDTFPQSVWWDGTWRSLDHTSVLVESDNRRLVISAIDMGTPANAAAYRAFESESAEPGAVEESVRGSVASAQRDRVVYEIQVLSSEGVEPLSDDALLERLGRVVALVDEEAPPAAFSGSLSELGSRSSAKPSVLDLIPVGEVGNIVSLQIRLLDDESPFLTVRVKDVAGYAEVYVDRTVDFVVDAYGLTGEPTTSNGWTVFIDERPDTETPFVAFRLRQAGPHVLVSVDAVASGDDGTGGIPAYFDGWSAELESYATNGAPESFAGRAVELLRPNDGDLLYTSGHARVWTDFGLPTDRAPQGALTHWRIVAPQNEPVSPDLGPLNSVMSLTEFATPDAARAYVTSRVGESPEPKPGVEFGGYAEADGGLVFAGTSGRVALVIEQYSDEAYDSSSRGTAPVRTLVDIWLHRVYPELVESQIGLVAPTDL